MKQFIFFMLKILSLYYFVFTFLIKKLDLKTPGREDTTVLNKNADINILDKDNSLLYTYIEGALQ